MSLTSYDLEAPVVEVGSRLLDPIRAACGETAATALVGAPVTDAQGRHAIATLMITGGEVRVAYRKMHPGADELRRFVPGDLAGVIDVHGWKVGLGICRDTGVAAHVSMMAERQLDLYVAGVVDLPHDHSEQRRRGEHLARQLAVPVAIASGAGAQASGFAKTAGCSFILGADASLVVEAGQAPDDVAATTLRG